MDFAEIEKYQAEGDWNKSTEILSSSAKSLELAGADYNVICTKTMHKVAPQIQSCIQIPIIHIAEETAEILKIQHISKVAFLAGE